MFQFGIGGMFGRPVGGNLATPSGPQRFGTIQDVSCEFSQKLVQLRGQNKGPDDIAPGDMDIKGKGGFGRVEIDIFNALYFADTVSTGVKVVVDGEAATVPAVAGPYTVQVTNHANFLHDLGVRYAATDKPLQQVTAGSEATGKYSVNETTGTYTFVVGDASVAMRFSYVYTDSANGRTMLVTNHIQGYGPIFELWLMQPYQGNNGLHLFACRSSKMSAPMKRDNYLISDFEFEAFPDAGGNWFEWFQVAN